MEGMERKMPKIDLGRNPLLCNFLHFPPFAHSFLNPDGAYKSWMCGKK